MRTRALSLLLSLAAAAALSGLACGAEEAGVPPGARLGEVRATEIVTYVDGYPIPSVNVDGNMAIAVEDLADYGFSVRWDPEAGILYADSVRRPETPPDYVPVPCETPGEVLGSVCASGIRVYVNGLAVPAFHLDGRMMVTLRDLAGDNTNNFWRTNPNRHIGYSNLGFRLEWDPDTSTSRLDALHIGDALEIDGTEYPIVEFLTGAFQEGSANPVIYQDGEELDTGLFGSRRDRYLSETTFQLLLEDYSWSFEEGAVRLRLPDTIPDRFFVGGEYAQQTQYPDRRGVAIGVSKDRWGAALPVVAVPVLVERNGTTEECQVNACVWACSLSDHGAFSWLSFDWELFEIVGLPMIETAP